LQNHYCSRLHLEWHIHLYYRIRRSKEVSYSCFLRQSGQCQHRGVLLFRAKFFESLNAIAKCLGRCGGDKRCHCSLTDRQRRLIQKQPHYSNVMTNSFLLRRRKNIALGLSEWLRYLTVVNADEFPGCAGKQVHSIGARNRK